MSLLAQAAVFLAAAVCVVPLARRAGLGAVLGYLIAGVLIGPFGARLITDVEDILHFAELGVVLLLFIIGLELQPSRLWALRRAVFGLGGVQVFATAALIAGAALALGQTLTVAIVVGLALSLSSTAFALQTLAEKGQLTTRHGRSAFAILLFQDLAVVPILALLPLFGAGEPAGDAASSAWLDVARVVGVLLLTVLVGRLVLGRVFHFIAAARTREVFTAMALLTVIGTAVVMQEVGLSMAMGAFMAGVLLADSEFRHALEADIEPFKGLLLGLFFIAVGMSVNLGLVIAEPVEVVLLTLALVAVKFLVLAILAVVTGKGRPTALRLAATISQGGEFAFVIFTVAVSNRIMDGALAELLILVVTLSMALTPPLFSFAQSIALRLSAGPVREFDVLPGDDAPAVIIAGFGRFGQMVGRILRAKKIPFTALDASAEHVDFVRRYGNKTYYGDASNVELLHAAQAGQARIFVLAIDDVDASLRTAATVREHFPGLVVYARARNRKHAYQLMDLGVKIVRRETFASSLEIAEQVLRGLGWPARQAASLVRTFREHDIRRLHESHASHGDEERMRYLAMESARELEEIFAADEADEDLHR